MAFAACDRNRHTLPNTRTSFARSTARGRFMMRLPLSLTLLCLSAIATAQTTTSTGQNQTTNSSNPILSTIFSTSTGLGNDRQTTIQVFTSVVTLLPSGTPAANGTSGNNTTTGGNNTISSTTTSSTQPSNLPTAVPNVDGGGNPAGAPSPGGDGGNYGPGDGYVAGALALKVNAVMASLAGVGIGLLMAL
ncbi:hypothetical protein BU17DRAFT_93005 [Hysterangium stoloniferum]|nr:hypothetical protein BU17DRAFT_93005 [Hysterangium stoloniferum]